MQLLKYNEFKTALLKGIRFYMPDKYKHYSIELHRIKKINQTLDGICMLDKSSEKSVSPVIYTEELYDEYLRCQDMDKVIEMASDMLLSHYVPNSAVNLDDPEKNIVIALVNYAQNKDKLKNLYHIRFYDMAIVFRLILKKTDDGIYGCLISNEMLEAFDISTDNLLEKAKNNTKNLLPVKIELLSEKYGDMFPTHKDMPILLLTNQPKMEGAAYMMYVDLLRTIKDVLKSDFYIVPASIHEVMLIPTNCSSVDGLKQILHIVNNAVVKKEEVLSENIYLFDGSIKRV